MEGIIREILTFILKDPTSIGMVGLLMIILGGVMWMSHQKDKELKQMIKVNQRYNDENRRDLLVIIQKYQEVQISVIKEINEIKILLATIGAKL